MVWRNRRRSNAGSDDNSASAIRNVPNNWAVVEKNVARVVGAWALSTVGARK